ncbi:MAG TPA: cobalamin-independent methionine synthase II family protein [Candidatus Binataceae bacterium]|nr:cobalamin-independent methionine synthase II family protein [Candidatus Binataceae bacterium]
MSPRIYRSQPIGSLLRPAYLREARRALRNGETSAAQYKRVEDRAVDEALALQEAAGLDVINDGEQRRLSFLGSLLDACVGLSRSAAVTQPWHEDDGRVVSLSLGLAVTGKLRRRRPLAIEEFVYARARARRPLKMTLPSPMILFMFWSPTESTAAYRDPFEMFADAAAIVREEIAELARLGCEYIQIDAPELTNLVDPDISRMLLAERGIAPARMLTEGVELVDSLAAAAPGVTFGLHLCRGNNDGRWLARGGYDTIARELFRRATHFHEFLLEYDDARAGSFEPLREVPRDKRVVLGLVSTKRNVLESADALRARIEEAARFFPREQLALSPQCGFASGVKGNPVEPAMQERKLTLVAELAREVWG